MAKDDINTDFSREDNDKLESELQIGLEGFDDSHVPKGGV